MPAWLWEVDIFEGKLRGLVLAEVELEGDVARRQFAPIGDTTTKDAKILLPEGVDLVEVTEDMRYTNASLAGNGFDRNWAVAQS